MLELAQKIETTLTMALAGMGITTGEVVAPQSPGFLSVFEQSQAPENERLQVVSVLSTTASLQSESLSTRDKDGSELSRFPVEMNEMFHGQSLPLPEIENFGQIQISPDQPVVPMAALSGLETPNGPDLPNLPDFSTPQNVTKHSRPEIPPAHLGGAINSTEIDSIRAVEGDITSSLKDLSNLKLIEKPDAVQNTDVNKSKSELPIQRPKEPVSVPQLQAALNEPSLAFSKPEITPAPQSISGEEFARLHKFPSVPVPLNLPDVDGRVGQSTWDLRPKARPVTVGEMPSVAPKVQDALPSKLPGLKEMVPATTAHQTTRESKPAIPLETTPPATSTDLRVTSAVGAGELASEMVLTAPSDGKNEPSPSTSPQLGTVSVVASKADGDEFVDHVRPSEGSTASLTIGAQPGQNSAASSAKIDGALTFSPTQVQATAVQISQHLASGATEFDIALRPAELGHLRIGLTIEGSAVSLTVQAERAESLELLRRSADSLIAELADLGFSDISMAFRERADREYPEQDSAEKYPEDAQQKSSVGSYQPPTRASATGLDLRL